MFSYPNTSRHRRTPRPLPRWPLFALSIVLFYIAVSKATHDASPFPTVLMLLSIALSAIWFFSLIVA